MSKKPTIAFQTDEEMNKELGKLAKEQDRSVSSIIRIAVKNYISEVRK